MRLNKKTIMVLIIVCLWLLVIFGFSAMNADFSSKITHVAIDIINKIREHNVYIDSIFCKLTKNHSMVYVIRKMAHITVFCILEIVVYCFLRFCRVRNFKAIMFSAIFSILYAFTDEFHQLFVSGRSAELKDVLIDSIGVFLGVFIVIVLRFFKKLSYKILAIGIKYIEKMAGDNV
jgi:VanZ family protein